LSKQALENGSTPVQAMRADLLRLNGSSSRDQVDDQNNERNHEQDMDQSTRDVKAEAQNPKHQNDHENCPKHNFLLGNSNLRALPDLKNDRLERSRVIGCQLFASSDESAAHHTLFSVLAMRQLAGARFQMLEASPTLLPLNPPV
jgi:hypothetical protein